MSDAEITQATVQANGLQFAHLELGEGPLALCLHGFPDSAWTWRHLMPELAQAGFRAVAPFLRGYAPTQVPADGRYQIGALGQDVVALAEALQTGDEPTVLIGHDWGAPSVYTAAGLAPERFRRVVGMSVPPTMGPEAFLYYEQMKRSFYIWFFQLPIAEEVVGADDLAFIAGLWSDWTDLDDHDQPLEEAKACLRERENLEAALGYYRALLAGDVPPELETAQALAVAAPPQPTLYLHGADDQALDVEMGLQVAGRLSDRSRVQAVEGTNHFLHLERPDEVNRLIVDWVAA